MAATGKDILIAFLLFCMFMGTGAMLYSNVADTYDVNMTETYNMSIYNRINETYALSQQMTDETRGVTTNTTGTTGTDEERYYRVIRNSLTSVLMIFSVLDFIPAMVSDLGGTFYVPTLIISTIVAIITIVVLWAVWKIFHRS